jgi:vanillate O-demethylase monooxygenase subunit
MSDAVAGVIERIGCPRSLTFNLQDWAILAKCWYPVARSDELGERPIQVQLLDVDLVVYHAAGKAVVARNLCVHRGTRLSLGWVEDDAIVCPYHGFRYGSDGRCQSVPAHPEMVISRKLRITVFPTIERFRLIWATLNGEKDELPHFEAWDDPEFQPIMAPTIDINSSSGRQVEGFLDVAHFAWAHVESFGDSSNPIVPSYQLEHTTSGIRAKYVSTVSNYPKHLQHLAPPDFQWLRVFEVFPPFSARLTVHFPEGGRLWILNAALPISARKTRLFCPLARNFNKNGPLEELMAFNLQIFNEDRVIVESQKPEDLPLDLQMEVHIAADRTSIAYRKLLKSMGLGSMYTS